MNITIDTDKENDQCYLGFGEGVLAPGSAAKTVRVSEDVFLDFDSEGRLVGVDVMNASRVLGQDYDNVHIDTLVGVKEAAGLLGLRPSNFVRDHASRADFPHPVAELGSGRIWLKSQVIDYGSDKLSSATLRNA